MTNMTVGQSFSTKLDIFIVQSFLTKLDIFEVQTPNPHAKIYAFINVRSAVVWWSVFPPVTRKIRLQFPAAELLPLHHVPSQALLSDEASTYYLVCVDNKAKRT